MNTAAHHPAAHEPFESADELHAAAGSFGRRLVHGGVAGLAGGLIFGMLMGMMGMLPMIASLVGSSSAAVGGVVHMVISLGFGAVFGVAIGSARTWPLLAWGAGYGVLLWIVGAQLIMPAMMGMPLFAMTTTAMMSLMGHVIYGLVAAVVLRLLRR